MTVYGQSKNGDIICLGIRLGNGEIGEMFMKGEKINRASLVGYKVVFYNKDRNKYYDIEVLKHMKGRHSRFIVKYQNEFEKEIRCDSFINCCNIGNIINEKLSVFQSLNTFRKVDNYYIITIETKNTKAEQDFNGQAVEVLFDGSDEVVNAIMNSSWYLIKTGKTKDTYYVATSNYNQTGQNLKLHKAVFNKEIPKGYVINHINRAEGNWKDNRLSNLELATSKENAKNKAGAGYPTKKDKSWYYTISIEGYGIYTPTRRSYEEADLDALMVQEHFGFTHRADEFYKIKDINQEYKNDLIQLMKQKLEKKKNKGIYFTKNEFEVIKIDEVEAVKVFDSKSRYTLIDKEDLWVLDKGRLRKTVGNYWKIRINNKLYTLHRYLLGIIEIDKFHHLQIDHINQNPCDNRKENLRITTEVGNKANKNSKGYSFHKNSNSYMVTYRSYHNILKLHRLVSNSLQPIFKNELKAKEEVYKRKYLANYIIPQFKNLDEYLIFEEEYNLNKKDGQTLDEYWITTRFPNINEIEIPKFSEENVDKL